MNIKNPKIWSLTDGSHGMMSQTRGLASELGCDIIDIKTNLMFPWSKVQPGIIPIFKWIFKNKIPENNSPDIVISCGRKSVYLSIYLKKKFKNVINIHIQNPKISPKYFSFIIAPNHDNFRGENIINSIGALHRFKSKEASKIKSHLNNEKLISCIIGGQNNHYVFTIKEAQDLCDKIIRLKKRNPNYKILVITSRRTNIDIKKFLSNKLSSVAKLWLGIGENPYEFALYNSKLFIITSDSTSMISEASISGKPIYIYQLPSKRKSPRFKSFHEEFKKLNITRDLIKTDKLENWSYNKLDESKRIAGIIKKRIIEGINESK